MNITTDSFGGRNVVFDKILEDIPGGVSLDKTRLKSDTEYISAGTPVNVNKSTRVAEIVKTAVCDASSADGDNVRVLKNHQFIAGESITDGYVVAVISSITTSNAGYDILVVATTLVNYAEGVVLVEANAGATPGEYAAATVTIATGKTIKVVDPTGKAAGVIIAVTAAADDNLAVSFAGKTLSIALASTTASKNTPAVEVQAAVRALTNDNIDFTGFVVTGDELAGSAITPASGTMAANSTYKYLPTGFVKDTVNVELSNADCSVVIRGTVREGSLPYPVNNVLKANLPLITFNS